MKTLRTKLRNSGYTQTFKHSLLELMVMLACSVMVLVLLAIFLFIGIQGARYFTPMSVYQITTYFYENNSGLTVTSMDERKISKTEIEYVLSHQSANALSQELQSKLKTQFFNQQELQPEVIVQSADNLYFLSTASGKTYVGEFLSLTQGKTTYANLDNLRGMQDTLALLQENLDDIQTQRLLPLHREINQLNLQNVSIDAVLYQRKLSEFTRWQAHANEIIKQIKSYTISLRLDNDNEVAVAVSEILELYQPNRLSFWESIGFSFSKIIVFLSDFPKQASTSGGVFPAIFGTLLMVIIMAIFVTPFGAVTAIYLHEYAPKNKLSEAIRICVSNMAAVPSVVYGVFGLGFFVYFLGGSIDQLLFAEQLPAPTFGTPGLLWAALTMGILTLPVMIVSTEEGLSRVPDNIRSGALALGATKFEVIYKVVLPIASPGILTGVILAIARAAGEVAPLILVGAVKFAPTLPIDNEFPYVHLERQFMHLGVFVYDGAFHNQTEFQVSSLMFATCMLLLIIVFLLNITAIVLRKKLREKYERL